MIEEAKYDDYLNYDIFSNLPVIYCNYTTKCFYCPINFANFSNFFEGLTGVSASRLAVATAAEPKQSSRTRKKPQKRRPYALLHKAALQIDRMNNYPGLACAAAARARCVG